MPDAPGSPTIDDLPKSKARPANNTSGLLKGNAAVLEARAAKEAGKAERSARQTQRIQDKVSKELADLPADMRANELVRQALVNKANSQVILDDLYARLQAGEPVGSRALDTAIKLMNQVQQSTSDLLAKWPREEKDKATRRIPRSVVDWLDNVESYNGKSEIIEPREPRR